MKYTFVDRNVVELVVEGDRDLFVLFKIIEKGDILYGEDYRVIKFEKEKEKIKVKIKIEVEEVKFSEYGDSLRVSGRILEASKEVVGHYHTFDIVVGSKVYLEKKKFLPFHIKELEKSSNKYKKIYVVSLDSKSIAFGIISTRIEILREDEIYVNKEDPNRDSEIKKIYSEYIKIIEKEKPEILCIVGPIFYPEIFYKYLEEKIDIKNIQIFQFKVSYGGINGIYEFIKRKEYYNMLKNVEILELNKIMEESISLINKGYIIFGIEKLKEYLESNNVEYILISEEFFKKLKSKENYEDLLFILDRADKINAEIYIVNEDVNYYELVRKFGVIAKIRYKI